MIIVIVIVIVIVLVLVLRVIAIVGQSASMSVRQPAPLGFKVKDRGLEGEL